MLMNLPQATVNLRSDGVMASVVFGSPGDFQVATIMAYYDYDIQSWCDWDLSKENGKPVLVEKITDKFIQRVIDWETVNTDSYKMYDGFYSFEVSEQ